jgi:hypothetical protein
MIAELEALIRNRAYELWEQEGRPQGRHEQHWAQAVEEVARGIVLIKAGHGAAYGPSLDLEGRHEGDEHRCYEANNPAGGAYSTVKPDPTLSMGAKIAPDHETEVEWRPIGGPRISGAHSGIGRTRRKKPKAPGSA